MIIGSTALHHWHPGFREPVDFDQFTTALPNGKADDNFWHESFPIAWNENRYATPDELLTIKISHSFWEVNGTWNKHAADILFSASDRCRI